MFVYLTEKCENMLSQNKIPDNFPQLMQYLHSNKPLSNVDIIPTTLEQDVQKYQNVIAFGTEYFYLADLLTPEIMFVSDNMTNILGYEPAEFNIALLFDIIHPDDRPMVIKSTVLLVNFARQHLQQRNDCTAQIDFRQRKKNGDYIRVLRQTGLYKRDAQGIMTHNLAMCTNITAIKKSTQVEFSMYLGAEHMEGFEEIKEQMRKEILQTQNALFSEKEIQILALLTQGYTSKQIAHALCNSPFTVDTHRKNMLQKSKMSNTAELITFAKNNAWI